MIFSQPSVVYICSIRYLPIKWWLNGCNCSRARSIWPSIAKPRGPPSVGPGNCCWLSKADTNQQRQEEVSAMALPGLGIKVFSVVLAIRCLSLISQGVRQTDFRQLFYKSCVAQTQLCCRSHWLIDTQLNTHYLDTNGCQASVTDVDMELYFLSLLSKWNHPFLSSI